MLPLNQQAKPLDGTLKENLTYNKINFKTTEPLQVKTGHCDLHNNM